MGNEPVETPVTQEVHQSKKSEKLSERPPWKYEVKGSIPIEPQSEETKPKEEQNYFIPFDKSDQKKGSRKVKKVAEGQASKSGANQAMFNIFKEKKSNSKRIPHLKGKNPKGNIKEKIAQMAMSVIQENDDAFNEDNEEAVTEKKEQPSIDKVSKGIRQMQNKIEPFAHVDTKGQKTIQEVQDKMQQQAGNVDLDDSLEMPISSKKLDGKKVDSKEKEASFRIKTKEGFLSESRGLVLQEKPSIVLNDSFEKPKESDEKPGSETKTLVRLESQGSCFHESFTECRPQKELTDSYRERGGAIPEIKSYSNKESRNTDRQSKSKVLTQEQLSSIFKEQGPVKKQFGTNLATSRLNGRTVSKPTTATTANSKNQLPSINNLSLDFSGYSSQNSKQTKQTIIKSNKSQLAPITARLKPTATQQRAGLKSTGKPITGSVARSMAIYKSPNIDNKSKNNTTVSQLVSNSYSVVKSNNNSGILRNQPLLPDSLLRDTEKSKLTINSMKSPLLKKVEQPDKYFEPSLPSLSRNSSLAFSHAEGSNYDAESFMDETINDSRGDFDVISFNNHTPNNPDDWKQSSNSAGISQRTTEASSNKNGFSIISHSSSTKRDNILSPVGAGSLRRDTNLNSLSSLSYDAQGENFDLSQVDTIRSGYTFRTDQPSADILTTQSDASVSHTLISDCTIQTEETESQGGSQTFDVISFNGNSSFSRALAPDEHKGTIKPLRFLGGGSEAKVHLIKFPAGEGLAALKLFLVPKEKAEEGYYTLRKEYQLFKHLRHSNIVEYYNLYKPKPTEESAIIEYGIIMEYMQGGSLEKYIEHADFAKLTIEDKKSFIRQILEGLEFLHNNNILYRDLKPGNLLLSGNRKLVKLADFGISKKMDGEHSFKQSTIGTPWYMAPEVINSEPYSFKADIWSAGCCFYHLLAGKRPYHQATAVQVLMEMIRHPSPLEVCEETTKKEFLSHPHLWEFLSLCFSQDKSLRPSASELLRHPFIESSDDSYDIMSTDNNILKHSLLDDKSLDSGILAAE